MFAPTYGLYFILIVLIFLLNCLSFILINKKGSFIFPKRTALFIFCLALLIRYMLISFFPFGSGYDISSFKKAGEMITENVDIYKTVEFRHTYAFFPTFALISSRFITIEKNYNIAYLFSEKLPIIFFDSLIAVLIYKITKRKIPALIYSISPIPIVISALYGQFEPIVLFFVILSLYFIKTKNNLVSFFSLGIAVIFKPWPLIFLPVIFYKIKGTILGFIFFLIPITLILLIYKIIVNDFSLINMLGGISMYSSVLGWWGPAAVLRIPAYYLNLESILIKWGNFTKYLSITVVILLSRFDKIEIFILSKLILLTVYIISFGFSIHYLLWIFPFALITNDKYTKAYMFLVSGFMILIGVVSGLTYNFKPLYVPEIIPILYSQILWLFFTFWFINQIRKLLRYYILG